VVWPPTEFTNWGTIEMISPSGMREKGIGFADRPVVSRPREPLDRLATSVALRLKTAQSSPEGSPGTWPHATPGRPGSLLAAARQAPWAPYGPLGRLGVLQGQG
jgi:hypothetical protein